MNGILGTEFNGSTIRVYLVNAVDIELEFVNSNDHGIWGILYGHSPLTFIPYHRIHMIEVLTGEKAE